MPKAIIMFGPPGVGKGTQSTLLAKHSGFFHCSTGDLFRNLDPTTPVGSKVKALIDKGNFVPDELTLELFFETLKKWEQQGKYDPVGQTIILDGVPRTTAQVQPILDYFEITLIILFKAPKEVLEKRLLLRGEISGRADDQSASLINKRFFIYEKDTLPTLPYLPQEKISMINGNQSIEAVYQTIQQVLE